MNNQTKPRGACAPRVPGAAGRAGLPSETSDRLRRAVVLVPLVGPVSVPVAVAVAMDAKRRGLRLADCAAALLGECAASASSTMEGAR